MRIRGCIIEYDLNEAAKMLDLTPDDLRQGIEAGNFQYYYQRGTAEYQFHEASISANQMLLLRRRRFSDTFFINSESNLLNNNL